MGRPLNDKQALKLAIECVQREIARIAVDANLHDVFGARYPFAIRASKKKEALHQAIMILTDMRSADRVSAADPNKEKGELVTGSAGQAAPADTKFFFELSKKEQ